MRVVDIDTLMHMVKKMKIKWTVLSVNLILGLFADKWSANANKIIIAIIVAVIFSPRFGIN